MRPVLALFLLCLGLLVPGASASDVLTVILVRHAEKAVVPPENKDPDLSPAGLDRARELQRMLRGSGVTAIFASHLKRTQQTVQPLADELKLVPTVLPAQDTAGLVKQIKARAGQIVLVAGHNNTVPEIIHALGGPKLEVISEAEYDHFFVLTVLAEGRAQLVRLRYGAGK